MQSNIREAVRRTLCQSSKKLIGSNLRYSTTADVNRAPRKFATKHYEEIRMPVPWGHIAGKWYGPKHVRPLLGLHGWQDNAGTFDTLAPLLSPQVSFLCLDLPGHGLSSWMPPGCSYHSVDYVSLMFRVMDEFKWDKISFLAHSMSAINSFVFSALFPSKVDYLISLDVLKPLLREPPKLVDALGSRLESSMKEEKRMSGGSEPPSYEWDQLVERLHLGSDRSVDVDTCKFLLQRNAKPSQHEPHKYYFARDGRLKKSLFWTFGRDVTLEMASRISCPHLFIKASRGPIYERKEYHEEALNVVRQNPRFEYCEVEGTHHVHLNDPDKVAPIINSFIDKYKP